VHWQRPTATYPEETQILVESHPSEWTWAEKALQCNNLRWLRQYSCTGDEKFFYRVGLKGHASETV
jgi:hypothetical protein